MTTKTLNEITASAGECLKRAVQKELRKKAMLGQYAIINRNDKPYRIPAAEALKISEALHTK